MKQIILVGNKIQKTVLRQSCTNGRDYTYLNDVNLPALKKQTDRVRKIVTYGTYNKYVNND